MTLEQIRYFLILADEGNFIRAAQRCGISQPSLSNAIKSLERSLGASLFHRTLKGSELTAFGNAIHPLLVRLDHTRSQVVALAATVNSSSRKIGDAPGGDSLQHHASATDLILSAANRASS